MNHRLIVVLENDVVIISEPVFVFLKLRIRRGQTGPADAAVSIAICCGVGELNHDLDDLFLYGLRVTAPMSLQPRYRDDQKGE